MSEDIQQKEPEQLETISTANKRLAKNTIALYIRMAFAMLVTLYTSRVVLQTLGVEDLGHYPHCRVMSRQVLSLSESNNDTQSNRPHVNVSNPVVLY